MLRKRSCKCCCSWDCLCSKKNGQARRREKRQWQKEWKV